MKLSRPPYILALPGDMQGCGWHRIVRPMTIMGRTGVATGRAESSFPSDQVMISMKPDVIVFQRQCEDNQIEVMDRWRTLLPEATFVFEVDDALSAVPVSSWHKPYMTPNIDTKLRKAVARCDIVTVTTDVLAAHMRDVCEPGTEVRVVPNMLGRDDLETASIMRGNAPVSTSTKLRIGWGGGIGHSGDLSLIKEAALILKDEVEWLFLGMDPEMPEGVTKTFMGAAPPDRYLASLAAMNVDLVVAPIEANFFNDCKSNLRLLEAGACSYPVIATPFGPYLTNSPPVTAYANNTQEWVAAIRRFISETPDQRSAQGAAMLSWVTRNYNMDTRAEERLNGWLPKNTRAFKPRLNVKGSGVTTVSNIAEFYEAFDSTNDILYIRPGSVVPPDTEFRLRSSALDIACAVSNDGGPWGFPNINQFSPIDEAGVAAISRSAEIFTSIDPIKLSAASGPCVLVKRSALAAIGCPDLNSFPLEVGLLEWACAARARGLKVGLVPSVYVGASTPSQVSQQDMESAAIRINSRWPKGENDEVSLKAMRQSLEIEFHKENFTFIPPQDRADYSTWAALADTRGPELVDKALDWQDSLDEVPVIEAFAYKGEPFNRELFSETDWLILVPEGAALANDYRQLVLESIRKHPDAKIFYADHDHLSEGKRVNPDLKPNFDLFLLLGRDYMTQCLILHKDVIPTSGAPMEDGYLYHYVLQAIAAYGRNAVKHIPRVVAHLPPLQITALMAHAPAKIQAAELFVRGTGMPITIEQNPVLPFLRTLKFSRVLQHNPAPGVSIIVPCKNNVEMLAPCIATLLTLTDYPGEWEIIICDNGSTRQEMLDYQASINDPRVRIIIWNEAYNWSALNTFAIQFAKYDTYCFLNDDTRVMSRNWLSEMVGASMLPKVGAVGAKLVYPHGQIQHVGVVCDDGATGHIHKGLPVNSPGTNGYAMLSHESTAVTGACLVVTKEKFDEVGGFELSLPHNFNDVDFCLKLYNKGYVNILAHEAELQHLEGVTRNAKGMTPEGLALQQAEAKILKTLHPYPDPYWNPNLTIALIQGGSMIAGMDMATFNYPAPPLPWVASDHKRIMVIGNADTVMGDAQDGAAIYRLDITGNTAAISYPPMINTGPWDIRRPDIAAKALDELGISKIILSDLGETSISLLGFLTRLGIPVEYRPINAEATCPRGDLKPDVAPCAKGYKSNLCQSCINHNSSPHGHLDVNAWRSAWYDFFANPVVVVELDYFKDPSFKEAVEFMYNRPVGAEIAAQ